MGHRGWRPGLGALCFCVWISGCTLAWQATPVATPAQLPPVTLIVRGRESTGQARPAPTVPASPTSAAAAATPVEYSVQPGDTLSGIASNYGLELAQLQAANPELESQFLQIGQRVRIPLTNAVPVRELLRLDLPPPDCWPLPTGHQLCLGQVINREERPVADVQLRLRAGAAGGLGSAALRLLPPGVAVPYSVLLPGNAAGLPQATLHSGHFSDARALALELRAQQVSQAGERYRVIATLYNASAEASGTLRLALLVLDGEERLRALRVRESETGLAAGAARDFVIEAQVAGEGLGHVLLVEAFAAQ